MYEKPQWDYSIHFPYLPLQIVIDTVPINKKRKEAQKPSHAPIH